MAVGYDAVGAGGADRDVELAPLTAVPAALTEAKPRHGISPDTTTATSSQAFAEHAELKMDSLNDVPAAEAAALQKLRHECVRWG